MVCLSQREQASVEARQRLAERLAADTQLVLPSSLYQNQAPTQQQAVDHLTGLAGRDPGAFLQRYGALLTPAELEEGFGHLRADYEVNHWLQQYCPQTSNMQPNSSDQTTRILHEAASTPQQPSLLAEQGSRNAPGHARVMNRRYAAMQRLQAQGEYFSMDSMRERAPLLYHQMVGQYTGEVAPQPPSAEGDNNPGSSSQQPPLRQGMFSDMLLRQHDEAQVRMRMAQEHQREQEQLSEHESDEDEDDDADMVGGTQATTHVHQGGDEQQQPLANAEQIAKFKQEFQEEMQQRFMFGQDTMHVDYNAIDADVNGDLDEHWAREANQDAEDAYFDKADDGEEAAENGNQVAGVLGTDEYDY